MINSETREIVLFLDVCLPKLESHENMCGQEVELENVM